MSQYKSVLKKYWGYDSFRPLQEDIIRSVAEDKKDTLGLLPTGGGKSILFQVPALAQEGICIVVTPLIALMKDQVENLQKIKVKAVAIHSGLTKDEIDIALNNCVFGKIKFLYVSPERLSTEIFKERIKSMNINLLAIDEAHCISQWGYDFRPSYLKIAEFKQLIPNVPVLALTATATPKVVEDIQEKLLFKEKNVFSKSFERKNLVYIVRTVEDKLNYLLKIVRTQAGTGIVYVNSRKKTKEIADFLIHNGESADFFHAGLSPEMKDHKQKMWKQGSCRIIVSTNAFGMGIDKPDVRFVVHTDLPESLEAYFQEAGRGGRDEKYAFAVLLYNSSDKTRLEKSISSSFPDRSTIVNMYNALGNYYQIPIGGGLGQALDFDIGEFARRYQFSILQIYSGLKILQSGGYIELTDEIFNPSRIKFIMDRNDLYKLQVKNSKLDAFVKLLLRSYTGLFTEYAKIDEKLLAQRAKTTREDIYQSLVKLSGLKIINYIPQKKTALIIYTLERLNEKSIFISKEIYEERRLRMQEKIKASIDYATIDYVCRSQMLLSYFGQKNAPACGVCDVCKENTNSKLNVDEYEQIRKIVVEKLKNNALDINDLLQNISFSEEKTMKTLKWLFDSKIIKYSKERLIELC